MARDVRATAVMLLFNIEVWFPAFMHEVCIRFLRIFALYEHTDSSIIIVVLGRTMLHGAGFDRFKLQVCMCPSVNHARASIIFDIPDFVALEKGFMSYVM